MVPQFVSSAFCSWSGGSEVLLERFREPGRRRVSGRGRAQRQGLSMPASALALAAPGRPPLHLLRVMARPVGTAPSSGRGPISLPVRVT